MVRLRMSIDCAKQLERELDAVLEYGEYHHRSGMCVVQLRGMTSRERCNRFALRPFAPLALWLARRIA